LSTSDKTASVNLYYTNARSLPGKIDELRAIAAVQKPDIILICETWTNPEVSNAELTVDGYNLEVDLRKDREDTLNGIGGGLLIYTKYGIKIRKNERFEHINFNQFSSFVILAKKPVEIIMIYRPPNSGHNNMEELCQLIETAAENTVLIGDFNVPEIDWANEKSGTRAKSLLEAVKLTDMHQLVNFATHDRGNILDLVLTNCCERILSVEDAGKLGNSDHTALNIELEIRTELGSKSIKKQNWNRADFSSIRNKLRETDWSGLLTGTAEEDWLKFKIVIDECVTCFVPLRTVHHTDQPRWINRDIIKLIRKKKAAWKQFRLYGTAESSSNYKRLEKEVKDKIRKSKRRMERELTMKEDRNGRNFANYIKSKTKSKTGIGPLKDDENRVVTDDKGMAQILNKFFTSVFTSEDMVSLPTIGAETEETLSNITITRDLIVRKIDKLRKESAPGPDNIHPHFMKETKIEISEPLMTIYRKSIDTGIVPEDWKTARVTPIFKKGTKTQACNYRPVSLTSVPCKILEGLIKDEMMKHLQDNNLIRDSQHGFIQGRSCATNLAVFMDKMTKIIDEGSNADIFYLDFAKAFDKVPHERLIIKLEAKGVTGKVKNWIREWLKDRSQWVVVGNESSEKSPVESGVPQGTILGPPLFTIHIDDIDLEALLAEILVKFADDTKGAKEIKSEEDGKKLQSIFDNLYAWSQKWGMEFNIPKCKIMHVGRTNPQYKYNMNGEEISVVQEEKDIGVIVQNTLKPGKQVEKAANLAAAVLRQIQRNFHYRDRRVFVNLYKQYVLPHLEFSSPVWAPWTVAEKEKLEQVQRRAVKMVAGIKATDYEGRCREIGLQTLEQRRKMADLSLVHGIVNGRGGMKFETMFEKAENRPGARTRQTQGKDNLKIPMARNETRRNFFTVRVAQEWNSLPDTLKEINESKKFKRALKSHMENGGRS
jgi:Reverse transcriptase (RNA-dependent DNA polymerase)/Endonuclease-reverse transcriptase